jgi:hypothetical protein
MFGIGAGANTLYYAALANPNWDEILQVYGCGVTGGPYFGSASSSGNGLMVIKLDATTADGSVHISINGSAPIGTAGTGFTGMPASTAVGLWNNFSAIQNAPTSFCEMVLCNEILSSPHETSLYSYFTTKWGKP